MRERLLLFLREINRFLELLFEFAYLKTPCFLILDSRVSKLERLNARDVSIEDQVETVNLLLSGTVPLLHPPPPPNLRKGDIICSEDTLQNFGEVCVTGPAKPLNSPNCLKYRVFICMLRQLLRFNLNCSVFQAKVTCLAWSPLVTDLVVSGKFNTSQNLKLASNYPFSSIRQQI